MDTSTLLAFALVALIAYVVPGPDWFVILRQASRSRRAGLTAAVGVQSGLVVHIAAAGLGVSALLLASAEAFTVVKLVGAAYLIFLGVRSLVTAVRTARRPALPLDQRLNDDREHRVAKVWASSFAANVLNPKAAIFMIAVLPQFIDPASPTLPQIAILGVVNVALGLAWWALLAYTVSHFKGFLRRKISRVASDGVSGVALVGLGGALAFTSRPA